MKYRKKIINFLYFQIKEYVNILASGQSFVEKKSRDYILLLINYLNIINLFYIKLAFIKFQQFNHKYFTFLFKSYDFKFLLSKTNEEINRLHILIN